MSLNKFGGLLVVVGLVCLPGIAEAVILNVDIQGQRNDGGPGGTDAAGVPVLYSGTGPLGGSFVGLPANSQTSSGSAADLLDGHNNANADFLTVTGTDIGGSGIDFSIVGVGSDNNSNTPASNFNSLIGDYVFNNDGSNNNNATPAFTFAGLQPGTTADLYFYLVAGGISIPGYSSTANPGPSPYTSNTLFFNDVLVGPGGTIAGNLTGTPGVLGGFTIDGTLFTPAPEPSTLLLALAGICVSMARCSRKRANRTAA